MKWDSKPTEITSKNSSMSSKKGVSYSISSTYPKDLAVVLAQLYQPLAMH